MDNKDHRSCPRRVFDNIFKAITFSAALKPIQRICHRPQTQTPLPAVLRIIDIQPKPASSVLVKPLKAAAHVETARDQEDAEIIHINFDYTTPNYQSDRKGDSSQGAPTNSEAAKARPKAETRSPRMAVSGQVRPAVASAANDKMWKPRVVAGGGGGAARVYSKPSGVEPQQVMVKEDRFTEFINQTRKRFNSPLSNVGDGGSREAMSRVN